MKNRLRQVNRTTVKTKTSAVRYVAASLALALFGGVITFIYLNTSQSHLASAGDIDKAWYIDFGSQIGTHTDKSSTSFISHIPSGTGRVSIVDEKRDIGAFILQNPGLPNLGSGSELKGLASSTASPAKFSVSNYDAGKSFYMKYSVQFDEAKDGEWYFFIGNGATFSDDNLFTQNEIFTGFQVVYNKKDKININYRNGNTWSTFPGKDFPMTPNTTYTIELYGNNSTKSINYTYGSAIGCSSKAVNSNSFDIYINGVLVAGNVAKAGIANDKDINSFMFYGIESKKNDAVIYLDDIAYSNAIPTSTLAPTEQPTNISFTDTTSSSISVKYTAANGNPDGYLVLRTAGTPTTATPVDMTDYSTGDVIGNATVVYVGVNTSFTDTNLPAGTEYHYKVFSYKGSGSCKNYLNALPLTGSQMTFYTEEIAAFSSLVDGTWTVPTVWEYEYLPGKFRKASKAPTKTNKSITVRKKHKITSNSLVTDNVLISTEGILTVNGDFTIENGSKAHDLLNEGTLVVTGKINVLGKMENKPGSIVELSGTSEQVIPEGTYAKLVLSNKGAKKLAKDISINEALILNASTLNTGTSTISLASTASIVGESKTNWIKGKIKTIRSLSNSVEKFGGIGAIIDATSNQEDLGKVTIIRSTGDPIVVGTSTSLSRNWSIEPEFQPKKDVKLTLEWNENDEDIPFDLGKMQVWKSTDKGKTWLAVGVVQDASDRKISVVTPSFSDWTLSDNINSLPVKFRDFSGTENSNHTATLEWSTTEELNNKGFEVEKSNDGVSFSKIGYVEGIGNSNVVNSYEFIDPTFNAKAYYRLKQIDFNGESDYSSVIFVDKKVIGSAPVQKSFSLYPNPVYDHATIGTTLADDPQVEVSIHSSKGREMYRGSGSLNEINDEFSRGLSGWEEDIYIIDIKTKGKSERIKMIKKG